MAARTAEHRILGKLPAGPNICRMVCDRGMAFKTGVPLQAAFESDRDYVLFGMPVRAARLRIDIDTANYNVMDATFHLYYADYINLAERPLLALALSAQKIETFSENS